MFWFGLLHPPCWAQGTWVMLSRCGIIANTWTQTPNKTPAWPRSLTQLNNHGDLSHPCCGLTKVCQHTINQTNPILLKHQLTSFIGFSIVLEAVFASVACLFIIHSRMKI